MPPVKRQRSAVKPRKRSNPAGQQAPSCSGSCKNHNNKSKNPFVFGNQLWRIAYERGLMGPPKKFERAEDLFAECVKYFQWLQDNPMYQAQLTTYRGDSQIESVPYRRVATLAGLCLFLGITQQTWQDWRKNREDLSLVVEQVDKAIYEDKFTGAAAGFFNANIIARDLGLADKKDLTSSDGSMTPRINEKMEAKEAADMYRQLLKDCKGGKE